MNIRKIIIFCLIAILCMGLSTNIFANEEVLKPVEPPSEEVMERATVKVYDEYDMYNSLQQQSPAALQAKGYTQQDIQSIKSTTYESLLRERGKLSTDELKNYGYSDAQIAILKNPNSTDAELRSASSKITVTTVVEKLEHLKDNYTYSTVYLNGCGKRSLRPDIRILLPSHGPERWHLCPTVKTTNLVILYGKEILQPKRKR